VAIPGIVQVSRDPSVQSFFIPTYPKDLQKLPNGVAEGIILPQSSTTPIRGSFDTSIGPTSVFKPQISNTGSSISGKQ